MAAARRRSHRLEYMGAMAAGLAHEIKNPLSTISVNLQLLAEDFEHPQTPLETRTRRRAETLLREVERLGGIVEDFLQLARGFELSFAPVDLEVLLTELARFVEPEARRAGIGVRLSLDPRARTVHADGTYLRLAILNLLVNARQAMETQGGGELFLQTLAPEGRVQISVTDTGPGIPEGQLERIFMPYVSTKKGGTGLGLPTARRIVEEHDGELTVQSEAGRGTRFTIDLPASGPAPEADA